MNAVPKRRPVRQPVHQAPATDPHAILKAPPPKVRSIREAIRPENLKYIDPEQVLKDSAVNEDQELKRLKAKYVKASCAFYAYEFLRGPPQAPYNGRFLIADHHEAWDRLVTRYKRLCVEAPRDHGKTYFFDFAYPIWKADTCPGTTGFIFSATKDQAIKILNDIKEEIESNPRLHHLLPGKRVKWSSTSIKLANGSRIFARGFGTKVRGAHPDWIVVDDGLNDESMYSETVRQKQKDYFYSAITNMIVPGGQIIVIGTPFHADDLYADLSKNKAYHFQIFPAISKAGVPLWPERYSKVLLDAKAAEIGSLRFSREFLCQAVSDAMSLFPSVLFEGEPTEQMALRLSLSRKYWEERGVTIFMGVDLAISSSVSADYMIIWTMGRDAVGNRWIIDVQRHKGLAYHRQLSLINTIAQIYKPALIYIEANQMQRVWGDELIRKTDLPIKKFITDKNKHSLEFGVPALRTLLENEKFRIPRGDARSVAIMDAWREEMKAFTWVEGKLQGLGTHDDMVMACWICNRAIEDGGFAYAFGENEHLDPKGLDEELMGNPEKEEEEKDDDAPEGEVVDPRFSMLDIGTEQRNRPKKPEPASGDEVLATIREELKQAIAENEGKPGVNLIDEDEMAGPMVFNDPFSGM